MPALARSWDFAVPQAMQQHGGRNRHVAVSPKPAEAEAKSQASAHPIVEEPAAGLVPSLEAAPAAETVKA